MRRLSPLLIALMICLGGASAMAQAGPARQGASSAQVEDSAPEGQGAQARPQLTLNALLRRAYKSADAMQVEGARAEHARWQRYRADRAWTPKIETNTTLAPVPANTDPNRVTANLDEFSEFNIGPFIRQTVRVVIPIYTFDRISLARELAELGVERARVDRQRARQEVAYQVQRAYFSLQLARAFQALIDEGQTMLARELERMEDARDFGEADFKIRDLRRLQIFEAEFKTRALDNAKLTSVSVAGLRYFTGSDSLEDEQVSALDPSAKPKPLRDYASYRAIAARQRPDLIQLDQAEEARRLNVELKKSEFYPNLFVAADFTFGWSNQNVAPQPVCRRPEAGAECDFNTNLFARPFLNPYRQLGFTAILGLRWSFDYGQLRGQLGEAQAQLAQTQAQRRQATGALELQLQSLHLDAAQALEKITIAQDRLTAARRWRDQLGLGAQQGADPTDAIEPLRAYYEARLLHLTALYNYQMARAELARAIGVDTLDDADSAVEQGPRE